MSKTHQSPRSVIMKIYPRVDVSRLLASVCELLGERVPELDVVRAATPLELSLDLPLHAHVAPARSQLPHAARFGHLMRDTRRR